MFPLAPVLFGRRLRMQCDFLHSPTRDLGGHDLVRISAVHGVYGGEFLSLLARLAKLAEDGPIQLHLVNFTSDGSDRRIVVIGIRIGTVQILMRAGSNAHRPGSANMV